MNLAALIARLGLAEVARRAGVAPSTIRKWASTGPSARGRDTLNAIASRHIAARKAAETRKKRAEFQASLPLPPEAYVVISPRIFPGSGYLSEEEVLPNQAPVQTVADLNRARKAAGYSGRKRINTNEYVGESVWLTMGKPILEVDIEALASQVIEIWRYSRRVWCHVVFLIFRYIPFNPTYKGEMVNKQGKWFDWWTSTAIHGEEQTIRNAIEVALGGAVQAAYNRVIWLESTNVRTFDNKADLPTTREITRRSIR